MHALSINSTDERRECLSSSMSTHVLKSSRKIFDFTTINYHPELEETNNKHLCRWYKSWKPLRMHYQFCSSCTSGTI